MLEVVVVEGPDGEVWALIVKEEGVTLPEGVAEEAAAMVGDENTFCFFVGDDLVPRSFPCYVLLGRVEGGGAFRSILGRRSVVRDLGEGSLMVAHVDEVCDALGTERGEEVVKALGKARLRRMAIGRPSPAR